MNDLKNKLLGVLGIKEEYFSARKTLNDFSLEINSHKEFNFDDTITIIIPSLNRLKVLKTTIKYLLNYKTKLKFKFIIIDNHSNSATKDYLMTLEKDDRFKVTFLTENLGGSGSRELALKEVTTEFVCFLDNDILVMPYYFENLLNSLKENKNLAGVQSKVILPNLKIQINNPVFNVEKNWIIFKDEDEGKDFKDYSTLDSKELFWMPIGATMWRNSVLQKYSIDKNFNTSFEDNDLTYRMYKDGVEFCNNPNAICMHLNAQFTPSSLDNKYMESRFGDVNVQNSARLFYKKHGLVFCYGNKDGFVKSLGFNSENEYLEFISK